MTFRPTFRPVSQRTQLVLSTLFLFCAALFSLASRATALESPHRATGLQLASAACPADASDEAFVPVVNAVPVVIPNRPARVVFVRGIVESVEEDFFGRPERVAIVSVNDDGLLIQNSVEDAAAGGELKRHVGEDVTARGLILVKADGSAALLVQAFEVHGEAD